VTLAFLSTADLDPAYVAEPTAELPAPREPRRRAAGRPRPWVPYVLLVLAQLVVALDVDLPVLRPALALATFVGVPALVLHRRATFPADTVVARLLYAVGLSLLGLLVGGLLLNTALGAVGIDRPLAPLPLAVAWTVVDAALLGWRRSVPLVPSGAVGRAVRRAVDARLEPAQALAVVALVLSVAGAVRLNNGAGSAVALAAVVVGAVALLVLLLGRSRAPARGGLGRDAWTLGLVATGLLLATSVRGWSITGHDIQAEYLAFRLTDDAQHWQLSALPSAYNACLSVTVLPTVLVQATGLPGRLVFSVLLQLVFATVPVLVYLLGRRVVSRRLALAGAVLTMAFPTFFTDMPYLVRQEVAFFFIALMLLAATEPARTRGGTRALVLAFGAGVVLSHYSTTYVLLMALVTGLAGLAVASAVRRPRGRDPEPAEPRTPLTLLHPLTVGVLLLAALAWAGPVTHTGGHAREVVRETVDALTGKGVEGPGSSDTSYWLFAGDQTTPRERMDLFVRATIAYRDAEIPAAEQVVPEPGPRVAAPDLHEPATAPLTPVGRALDAVGLDPVHADNAMKLGCAALMQVVAMVGVAWLLLRRRRRSGATRRGPSREYAFLAWGAMGGLALVVLVPNLSVEYGVLRAFQQTLLVVAPVMAMGLWVTLRPVFLRAPRLAARLVGVVPVVVLLVLAGVLPALLGGQQQRLALANAGGYYDRFFVSDSEMRAVEWLGSVDHADRTNERIIANRNLNVRLLGLSGNRAPVADRLFPTLLSRDAYVFVDAQILDRGVSTVFYTGDLLTYTYPLEVLDHRLDLLYSSPQARIYR
jgi:uncharacterized membrane protein